MFKDEYNSNEWILIHIYEKWLNVNKKNADTQTIIWNWNTIGLKKLNFFRKSPLSANFCNLALSSWQNIYFRETKRNFNTQTWKCKPTYTIPLSINANSIRRDPFSRSPRSRYCESTKERLTGPRTQKSTNNMDVINMWDVVSRQNVARLTIMRHTRKSDGYVLLNMEVKGALCVWFCCVSILIRIVGCVNNSHRLVC